MKSKISIIICTLMLAILPMVLTSCSKKKQAIRHLEELAADVKENGDVYGLSEWVSVYEQYSALTAEVDKYRAEYSVRENRRINLAKSEIREAFYHKITNMTDVFGIKEKLLELFGSSFDESSEIE